VGNPGRPGRMAPHRLIPPGGRPIGGHPALHPRRGRSVRDHRHVQERMSPGSHLVLSHTTGGENRRRRTGKQGMAAHPLRAHPPLAQRNSGLLRRFRNGPPGPPHHHRIGTTAPPPTNQAVILSGIGKLP
jgi:hypothetical protein